MDTLRLLFYLMLGANLASTLSLKGGDFPCTQPDGQEIRVPGITDVPTSVKIKCICQKGVGKCQKVRDVCLENLQGCHFFVKNSMSNDSKSIGTSSSTCTKECRPCGSDQTRQKSGQILVQDKCNIKQCFSGVSTQTTVHCATPMCPNPRPPVQGQCCPTCKGCSRAGQIFEEAESKPDVLDPCNQCTCKAGHLECVKKACPVLPCQRHLVQYKKGQCCPVCSRSVEYKATPGTCTFRGRSYRVGQNIPITPSDHCTKCKCGSDMPYPTVQCERQTCPSLWCPTRMQRLQQGQCCPTCSSSGRGLIGGGGVGMAQPAVRAPIARECILKNGQNFRIGDVWQSGCETCQCMSNGQSNCQAIKCPSCPPGAQRVQRGGQCCPSCDGVCTVFGDPHYRTFDGRVFNFQGSCKYLLATDGCGPNGRGNSTFSVRITNDARDSLAFSWTRTITIRLYEYKSPEYPKGLKISLMQKMRVKVNGKKVNLEKGPFLLMKDEGHLSIIRDGYRISLRTGQGLKLLWDGVSFLEMTVPSKYRNELCGLCGNFNGEKSDDFDSWQDKKHLRNIQKAKEQTLQDGQRFGASWRVGGLRACSVLPKDMPQSYESECTQSWDARIKSDKFCNALKSPLFAQCAGKVNSTYYYNACKTDMCECPGDQCHCEVLTAYARECELFGQRVDEDHWRESTGCKNVSSFKYGERIFTNPSDDHQNHQNDVIQNSMNLKQISNNEPKKQNHQSTPLTTTATTTTTTVTPSTTSTTTIRTELPDWIGLGPSLPGCSRKTAQFCQQNNAGKKLKIQRPKYPRSRRRYERKKNNRKNSGKTQKQKRKQRRKRKKKERRRRQRQLRKQRNNQNQKNQNNQKQSRVYKMGDYALNMDKQRENRKIQWSSIVGSSQQSSKIPPFEALLSSSSSPGSSVNKQNSEENNNNHQNNEEEFEDLSDPSSYFDEISSSDFQTKSGSGSRRNGRKRTPLPLKEARDDLPDQNGDQRGWKKRKRK